MIGVVNRFCALLGSLLILFSCSGKTDPIRVGSKNFTESVILAEIVAQTLEAEGCRVDRRTNLGGTLVAHSAITSGALDAYVEYSGTALTAILNLPASTDRGRVDASIRAEYEKLGLVWGPKLGFNNTFAMIVRKSDADAFRLETISDLRKVERAFQPGFGPEFAARPDGYDGLRKTYGLEFSNGPKTMDLGLTYRALASGQVDLIAGNSTDGLIDSLGLVALRDDRDYFPPYDAAVVYRREIDSLCAGAAAALSRLEGAINEEQMRRMNFEVDGSKRSPAEVAREFLAAAGRGGAPDSVGR